MEELPLADLIEAIQVKLASGEADRYADCYNMVGTRLLLLYNTPASGITIDPAIIQWLFGAEQVNRGIGPFSDFIRSYTAEQYLLRTDNDITPALLQQASNQLRRRSFRTS